MIAPDAAFVVLPDSLRRVLLDESRSIVQNFLEHRWLPSELSGGKLCEVIHTILDGYAKGVYSPTASKPRDFVGACRALEAHTHVPRSFQILIPRLLPALYEIRNNRGVGHVGGDVDPNHMDAIAVLSMANWLMAELVRVLHRLSTQDAQTLVDVLAERRTPLVWLGENVRRVLDPEIKFKDHVLVLLSSKLTPTFTKELQSWMEYKHSRHFVQQLRQLHKERLIELSADDSRAQLLPPGSMYVEKFVSSRVDSRD